MRLTRQDYDIEIYREDNIWEELEILDSESVPFDISSYEPFAQIRRSVDGDIILELDVTVLDASVGSVVVSSGTPVTDLDLGPDGVGVWDLEIVSNDATPMIFTSHRGNVTFVKDVTHEE